LARSRKRDAHALRFRNAPGGIAFQERKARAGLKAMLLLENCQTIYGLRKITYT
jgi:hypothetical protein